MQALHTTMGWVVKPISLAMRWALSAGVISPIPPCEGDVSNSTSALVVLSTSTTLG